MTYRNKAVRLKTSKGRSVSSTKWLNRQLNDPFVAQSKQDGYISRAAYKLIEINDKFNILSGDKIIIDLGASPGSWTQLLGRLGVKNIIAVDLKPLEIQTDAHFVQGDFRKRQVVDQVLSKLGGKQADAVLSDMAHNASGHKALDSACMSGLWDAAFEFAKLALKSGGTLVIKVIQNGYERDLVNAMRKVFEIVKFFKPQASRRDSSEIYVVALNYKVD